MTIAVSTIWPAVQIASTTTGTQGSQTILANTAYFILAVTGQAVTGMHSSIGADSFQFFSAPADLSGQIVTIGYCLVSAGGAGVSITVTTGVSTTMATAAMSFTGLATTLAFDRSNSVQSTVSAGSFPSGSISTRINNEVLISLACVGGGSDNTWTKDAAFTVPAGLNLGTASTGRTLLGEYQIVSSTGTYSATPTSTNVVSNGNNIIASFADTPITTTATAAWVTA